MSDDELKITRRRFLQHSAMATAMTGGLYSIAMKTDAVARADEVAPSSFRGDGPSHYPYMEPPG